MTLINTTDLGDEAELIWLEDVADLDYVRESVLIEARRSTRQPRPPMGRLVGYSTIRPDAPGQGHYYQRRCFWLKSHDRGFGLGRVPGYYEPPSAPAEAVDPRTVAVGVPGEKTDRCWFGPNGQNG